MKLPVLHVFSREGCHLCDVLVEQLEPLVRGRALIEVHDVDTREDWQESYGLRVPVIELDGRCLCEFELDSQSVDDALGAE
jgi:hypothetical protein